MSLFTRITNIFKAKSHAAVDEVEKNNAGIIAEQAVRDMKTDLETIVNSLAGAMTILKQEEKAMETAKEKVDFYQNEVRKLVADVESGKKQQSEIELIGKQALKQKNEYKEIYDSSVKMVAVYRKNVDDLKSKKDKLSKVIDGSDKEVQTIKRRVEAAQATEKINKTLAGMDANRGLDALKKMKEHATELECRSEAYGEIADSSGGLDEELEKANASCSVDDEFAGLFKK